MNNIEERLFHWNEKSILWYQNAATYGSYHEQLAKRLIPHIDPSSRVCDLGCGVGYLTKELSPFVKEITGCDANPKAIEFLRQQIKEHQLGNVEALLADIERIDPPKVPYDTVILCLFGGLRNCYDQSSTKQEIYDYLNEKLIMKQEDETYPFYLPNEKRLAMFVIERNGAE